MVYSGHIWDGNDWVNLADYSLRDGETALAHNGYGEIVRAGRFDCEYQDTLMGGPYGYGKLVTIRQYTVTADRELYMVGGICRRVVE